MDSAGCGCAARKARLNRWWPGLGDLVERALALLTINPKEM